MLRKLLFYVLLGVATVGLSRLLGAWRAWRAAPDLVGGAAVVVFGLVVLGAMLWLGFLLYEVDRAAGRVRRRVGIYEWVIRSRSAPGGHTEAIRLPTAQSVRKPAVAHRGSVSGAAGGERRG